MLPDHLGTSSASVESSMVLPWCFHDASTGLPRDFHGASMETPWDFHGSTLLPWAFHGTSMEAQCLHRDFNGAFVVLLWKHSAYMETRIGNSMGTSLGIPWVLLNPDMRKDKIDPRSVMK